jgi:hypothetical protein
MMRTSRSHDDRGLVLPLSALLLVGLLLVAALVIDLGGLYNARRQDQSAADAAALAAVQEVDTPSAMVNQVVTYANNTLGESLTAADFNTCGESVADGRLPVLARDASGNTYDCISMNSRQTLVRVRIPTREHPASFARVVRSQGFDHSAFAIAGLQPEGFGGVLPYGLGAGSGGHVCLKEGPGGISLAPCSGPSAGNFRLLDFGFFESQDCNSNPAQARRRAPSNIALGIDHRLRVDLVVEDVDTDVCANQSAYADPRPSAANVGPGNGQNALGNGLWAGDDFGSTNLPARLRQQSSLLPSSATTTFSGGGDSFILDDNPLWRFIPLTLSAASANIPESCERSYFDAAAANPGSLSTLPAAVQSNIGGLSRQDRLIALLDRCFTHYRGEAWMGFGGTPLTPGDPPAPAGRCSGGCTSAVFSADTNTSEEAALFDIQFTPRFGYVPEVSGFPAGNSGSVRFTGFRAVYIQRVCLGSNACPIQFDPGFNMGSTGLGNGRATTQFTAWAFGPGNVSMLPGDLGAPDAPFRVGTSLFVRLVR